MTDIYFQTGIALAVVIGMIVLIGFILRKKQGNGSVMRVIAYQSFGQRKGVAALKVGSEVLLLGITTSDLKLLKTMSEDELEKGHSVEADDGLRRLREIKELLNEHK